MTENGELPPLNISVQNGIVRVELPGFPAKESPASNMDEAEIQKQLLAQELYEEFEASKSQV